VSHWRGSVLPQTASPGGEISYEKTLQNKGRLTAVKEMQAKSFLERNREKDGRFSREIGSDKVRLNELRTLKKEK
jgi:hypothetical protein